MLSFTNYYQQTVNLPAKNCSQQILLHLTDVSTFAREISKALTVVGLGASALRVLFNVNETTDLAWTAAFGVSWLLSKNIAQRLEPQAKNMIAHFKKLQEERTPFSSICPRERAATHFSAIDIE